MTNGYIRTVTYRRVTVCYMTNSYILRTCAASRMIYLEVLIDQSTEIYLRSQRRFIAQRGVPKMIKGRLLRTYNATHEIK